MFRNFNLRLKLILTHFLFLFFNSSYIYFFQPIVKWVVQARKKFVYSEEYLKFGFIPVVHDERSPFCLLCQQCLTNESMKQDHLEAHLKAKLSAYINSVLNYFQTLKKNFEKRATLKSLFTAHTATVNYQISLLIAKSGENHTIGENLIKPSISAFLKMVLEKDDKDVKAIPLSTISRRIDEMSEDIEMNLLQS